MAKYTCGDIKVLTGGEAVRKRPGMYVGDVTDGFGLHQLLWELVGNSLDQFLRERATRIDIAIEREYLTVTDDGPGMSPEVLDRVLTTICAGSAWDERGLSALGRCGLAPVNFVSGQMAIESHFRGRRFAVSYRQGIVDRPLRDVGKTDRSGLRVALMPDAEIFPIREWDLPMIGDRLDALACLNPGLSITLNGICVDRDEGLSGLAAGVGRAIGIVGRTDDIEVEVALRRLPAQPVLRGFVNHLECSRGSHVDGLLEGLVASCRRHENRVRSSVWRELFDFGLAMVVRVDLSDARFSSAIWDRLDSPMVRSAVRRVVSAELRDHRGFAEIAGDLIQLATR